MKGLLIIVFFSLTCAHASVLMDTSQFDKYIQEYELDYSRLITDLPFKFDNLNEDIKDHKDLRVGVCHFFKEHMLFRSVSIDFKYWQKYSDEQRRFLIYHELGHCDGNLRHRDFKLVDGCPGSIMNHQIASHECAKKHWDYYKDELHYKYNHLKYYPLLLSDKDRMCK